MDTLKTQDEHTGDLQRLENFTESQEHDMAIENQEDDISIENQDQDISMENQSEQYENQIHFAADYIYKRIDGVDKRIYKKIDGAYKRVYEDESSCAVCGDRAFKQHYGVLTCAACAVFFSNSMRKGGNYVCGGAAQDCPVHHQSRSCPHCRLQKCLSVGMKSKGESIV